jgi:hypothetical protein
LFAVVVVIALVILIVLFVPGARAVATSPIRAALAARTERRFADEQTRAFERLQAKLRARYGDVPPPEQFSTSISSPNGTGSFVWPERDAVEKRALTVGFLRAAEDNDAAWFLAVVRDHPDLNCRIWAASALPWLLSEGDRPGDALKSALSVKLKAEVASEIVRSIVYPRASMDWAEDRQMLLLCFSGRLWRIDAIRDAMLSVRDSPKWQDDDFIRGGFAEMDSLMKSDSRQSNR